MANNYNFNLPHLPQRTVSPRKNGVTMVMDKGISLRQAEDFLSSSSDYVDFVKLGFGTSIVSKNVKEKIKLYKDAGIKVYVGGTLFEAFVIRNKFDDYLKYISDFGTRQFLLKSLHWQEPGQLAFRFNLAVLTRKIDEIGKPLSEHCIFDNPTLFIRGGNSNYILDEDFEAINHHFPNSKIETIPDTGHWLHAENPKLFYFMCIAFLK
jgi:pimeloyl-ACP methyl ester carboxylesterase